MSISNDPIRAIAPRVGADASAACTDPAIDWSTPLSPDRFEIVHDKPPHYGGMGKVLCAIDKNSGTSVALKILYPPREAFPQPQEDLFSEAKLMNHLKHPNIPRVIGAGIWTNGSAFFAMQYINGSTLHELVESSGESHPIQQMLPIFEGACGAVSHAHALEFAHCDVTPRNIMVERGLVLVIDWGLARKFQKSSPLNTPPFSHGPSQPLFGTPEFASTEQACGHEDLIGPWTDIYGLGATLYNLVTGRPPYQERSARILRGHYDPLRERALSRSVLQYLRRPAELITTIHHAIDPIPAKRYQNCGEFLDALASCV